MKIYLNQNGQTLGPFSKEDIQNKIYSGELSRTDVGCVEGAQAWRPLAELLDGTNPASPAAVPPPLGVSLDQLRDPKEKTALLWLYLASVPVWLVFVVMNVTTHGAFVVSVVIFGGLFWLARAMAMAWFAAYLKTNAVRVSETQLPDLHRAVQSASQRLGLECPDVYILQHNVWNAFATKLFKRRVVVLLSGAVDSILLKGDQQQLSWVIGHELGHHWAGHLDLKQKFAKLGGWLIWVNFWHSRRRELTCDRVGLFCSGSLRSSQLALANMTVGAQLASQVDASAIAAQWQQHRGEFFVKYLTLYSTYPQVLARMDHLNQAAQEFGMGRS